MERLLKWLDDLDDALVVFHVHLRTVLVTILLLIAFAVVLAAVLVLGQPELLAAP